jgi:aryl-alcohol dehydrogenase-like predicted oxidoreductase
MEYTRLGDTGLRISRLALGCMSYGDPTTEGAHRPDGAEANRSAASLAPSVCVEPGSAGR